MLLYSSKRGRRRGGPHTVPPHFDIREKWGPRRFLFKIGLFFFQVPFWLARLVRYRCMFQAPCGDVCQLEEGEGY